MAVKSLTRRERRRKKLLKIFAVLFVLALGLVCMYSSVFKITDIEIKGAQHTDIGAVEIEVKNALTGYRYFILPNDHILFYPKKTISELILNHYPSVEKFSMSIDRKRNVQIEIKDRRPLGVWCGEKCYFYDPVGIIFKESFKYTGPVFTSWERSPKQEIRFLSEVSCEKLCTNTTFTDFIKLYQIEKAVLTEEMVEFKSANGYTIKAGFNATTTINHIKKISEQKPGFIDTLEYIDVRFPTKIFYKERM